MVASLPGGLAYRAIRAVAGTFGDRGDARDLRANGVALAVESDTAAPALPRVRNTRLPVDLQSFRPSVKVAGVKYNAATGETFGGSFGAPRSRYLSAAPSNPLVRGRRVVIEKNETHAVTKPS